MAFNDKIITVDDDTPLNQPIKYVPELESDFLQQTSLKLSLARYPEEQQDFAEHDWSQGAKVKEVARLTGVWRNRYDWSSRQVRVRCRAIATPS